MSDPDSTVIRRFGLLNEDVPTGSPAYGIPHPVTFVLDPQGRVVERYAEPSYANRRTAASVLTLEGANDGETLEQRRAPHFTLRLAASNATVHPGQRVTLVTDLALDEGLHAYAAGAHRYRPLELRLAPDALFQVSETRFPPAHDYHFEPLNETVPVFEGQVRLLTDVTLGDGRALREAVSQPSPEIVISGELRYQVCSDELCYPPAVEPVAWHLRLEPLDLERVPEELRRH